MEIEFGRFALIHGPSLIALIPLIVYIVLAFRGKSNTLSLLAGIFLSVIILGLDLKTLAKVYHEALGSTTALIGMIIIAGSGLGVLMNKTGVTQTLVHLIVQVIGVNTKTKAKITLIISSIIVCGMLGTLGGGNAILGPILVPMMAAVGVPPTVVGVLLKTAGEVGLIVGPLTGVTLITMEVTGMTYAQLMLYAVIPFSLIWLAGTWIGANKIGKELELVEAYPPEVLAASNEHIIDSKAKKTTIAFFISFLLLVGYGVYSKQGTNYALIVMILLAVIITLFSDLKAEESLSFMTKGMASQFDMLLIFINLEVLLVLVAAGGGFDALGDFLGGIASAAGSFGVYITAALVGGFGIEAAAVAEIKIIADMFGGLASDVGLPMSVFATCILAATRLTGSMYPTSNFAGQMGIARSTNTKDGLRIMWIAVAFVWVWVLIWGFVGPRILG